MVFLNPAAYFRPVSYTLSRMLTLTLRPFFVLAFAMWK